jgi:hypothetical protein
MLPVLSILVSGLRRYVKVISRVVLTVVSSPSTQPLLTVPLFDVPDVDFRVVYDRTATSPVETRSRG